MSMRIFAAITLVWCLGTVGLARGYQTAAVFPMSSVEQVDIRNQLLTFKTQDGQLRVLRVAGSAAMQRESVTKGDLVSIEVDLDDQIVKIVKEVAQPSASDRRGQGFK